VTTSDFFISHATPDREWAQWIAWQLEAAGLTTYLPMRDLRPGYDRRELEEAIAGSRRAIITLSPDYIRSDLCEREWRAIADREENEQEPTLVPVRVRECEPTGQLGRLAYVDLVGLDEQGAAEQLTHGVSSDGRRRGGRPAFPSSVSHARADEPQFPRDLATLDHPLELVLTQGDILGFDADAVVFKYASDAEGAGAAATEALRPAGIEADRLQPDEEGYALVATQDRLAAQRALFVGVPQMSTMSYPDIRAFGARVLEILAVESPRTAHVATTTHGPGVSLDEVESLLSLVAGFLDALKRHQVPSGLERITIVEARPKRLEQMGKGLQEHLNELPDASLASRRDEHWVFRIGVPGQSEDISTTSAPEIALLERTPETDPHVFVAFPFALGDHFRYGIQGPARAAGFLCEHFGEEAFMGDILDRVKTQIEHATVVIGVLTDANPNVYLEVGYAWGKRKPTILVAKNGEELRFDVRGHRCLLYTNIEELEKKMTDELAQLHEHGVI